MINTEFQHPDQQFELVYGSHMSIWENAPLDDSVDKSALGDGVWLTLLNNGKYAIADDGAPNAYPILEMKHQYDNMAAESVTVAKGMGWYALTKRFDAQGKALTQGMFMKVAGGILVPIGTGEERLMVARIERVVNQDLIMVQKI